MLVRTNPLAEISRIIPVSYLVPFSVAQKIDLSNKPENVHVIQTPVIYLPTGSGYEKLGRNHLQIRRDGAYKNIRLKFDIIHAHFTWSAGYVGSKLKETYEFPLSSLLTGWISTTCRSKTLFIPDTIHPYPEFRGSYHHRQPE